MIPNIIKDGLEKYAVKTVKEEEDALKEILQEIILQGLSHTDFFAKAVFHGGSCLRIVYDLPRFSEDLDFVLKQIHPDFTWQPYQKAIAEVCQQYGIYPEIKDKSKVGVTVQKMFLKDNSIGKFLELSFKHPLHKKFTIKLEIDINPPAGCQTAVKFLDFPVNFPIEIQDLPSSFASKSHALLCRKYLKGRDWYDFLWYVNREVLPNLDFLANALHQQGPWANQPIQVTAAWYINQLREKIQSIDWEKAKDDISPFLRSSEQKMLLKWNVDLFLEELSKLSKQW